MEGTDQMLRTEPDVPRLTERSRIGEHVDALSGELDRLGHDLDQLEVRLMPVLGPHDPRAELDEVREDRPQSSHAADLESCWRRLATLSAHLRQLTGRIEA
jgi:hypothetical protein